MLNYVLRRYFRSGLAVLMGGRTVVADTFSRVDSNVTMGAAETGQAWVPQAGIWGISSGAACQISTGAYHANVIDSGFADVTVTVTQTVWGQTASSSFAGICARCTDDNNFLYVENNASGLQLFKRVAGTFTQIGSTVAGAAANGDVLKLVCRGNTLTVYRNSVALISQTDSFNNTATKHGIAGQNTVSRLDDFRVTVP